MGLTLSHHGCSLGATALVNSPMKPCCSQPYPLLLTSPSAPRFAASSVESALATVEFLLMFSSEDENTKPQTQENQTLSSVSMYSSQVP